MCTCQVAELQQSQSLGVVEGKRGVIPLIVGHDSQGKVVIKEGVASNEPQGGERQGRHVVNGYQHIPPYFLYRLKERRDRSLVYTDSTHKHKPTLAGLPVSRRDHGRAVCR